MFNFTLPEARIAKRPPSERENAKLMVVHKETGEIEHKKVGDLQDYFSEGDVMVTNNTKVFPQLVQVRLKLLRPMRISDRASTEIVLHVIVCCCHALAADACWVQDAFRSW